MSLIAIPLLCVAQKVGASQLEASVRGWFIENDFRLGRVNNAFDHQVSVDEVEAHGPLIRSADATEAEDIPLPLRFRHVLESLGRIPDNLD